MWAVTYLDIRSIDFTSFYNLSIRFWFRQWQQEPLSRNESGRFGALKSDSTHHFFRNACTKSGSLRFSQFSGCWLILSVYIHMSFDCCEIVRSSVILLLPLLLLCFFFIILIIVFANLLTVKTPNEGYSQKHTH